MLRPDALADFVALLGFVLAGVMLVVWYRGVGARTRGPYLTLAAAMALMALVSFSNVLEHVGLTAALDRYEDYAEVLFLPLMAYGLYLMWTDQQFEALAAAQRVAKASHEMLLGVVDTSPVGIVVIDPAGDVTFANAYADSVLGHCDTEFETRECFVKVVPAGSSPAVNARIFDVSLVGRPATSELWECVAPDGARTQIQVSARPYHGVSGTPTGSVVVFSPIR